MNEKQYNKKILFIFRIVLFAFGFAIGFLAMFQILDTYNDLVKNLGLKIVFYVSSGLVPAAALSLSAKGVYRILEGLIKKVAQRATALKVQDLAAVLLSAVIGTLFGYLSDIILSNVLNILALRLFVDILAAMFGIYIVLILAFKWLKNAEKTENSDNNFFSGEEVKDKLNKDGGNKAEITKGYLLTLSALKNPKTYVLFSKLLIGDKYVLLSLVNSKELVKDETAAENLARLKAEGCIQILIDPPQTDKNEGLKQILSAHSLKPVVWTKEDAEMFSDGTKIPLILDEL